MDVIQDRIFLNEFQADRYYVALPPLVQYTPVGGVPGVSQVVAAVYQYAGKTREGQYCYVFMGVEVK